MLYHGMLDEVRGRRPAGVPDMEALRPEGCLRAGVPQHNEHAHGFAHDGEQLSGRWALERDVPASWRQLLQPGQQLLDEPGKPIMDEEAQRNRQVQLPERYLKVQLPFQQSFLQAQDGHRGNLVPHGQRLKALPIRQYQIFSTAD